MSVRRPEHKAPPELVSNHLVFHLFGISRRFPLVISYLCFQFYNDEEARKYTQKYVARLYLIQIKLQDLLAAWFSPLMYLCLICSSRMIDIQIEMSERALELLVLPEDTQCHILDLGCGSGLSGSVLEEQGHTWVGLDISSAMLSKI